MESTMRTGTGLFALLVTLAFAAPALSEEIGIPARKAGEWEITMTMGGKAKIPPMTMKVCLDEKTDAEMMKAGLAISKDACPRQDMSRDGDDIVIDSTCSFGGMETTSHIVVSGDFQSSYTLIISSSIEGAPAGMPKNTEMTQTARWVAAACKGMKPGEMMMPGGMKIDATKMMKGMGGG
jgi:hypothetical protein